MKTFIKLNSRPLKVQYTKPVKKEPRAFFQYNGQNIYLDQIVRTDTPWGYAPKVPDYISGIVYDRPYGNYIEICPDGEHANLYDRRSPD